MYTEREVDTILYQSWDEIGNIAHEIAVRREEGKDCSALIDRGYDIRVLIQGYQYGEEHGLETYKGETILKALICLAGINDFPAANLICRTVDLTIYDVVRETPGDQGEQGDRGEKGDEGEKGEKGDEGVQGEKGDKPSHEWSGTRLRFENPDGSWGLYTDLKGDPGQDGADGTDGAPGTDGTPGTDGADGVDGQDGDTYKTTSTTSVAIPETHPTQVTMTLGTGLSYSTGQEVVTSYDINNYFTGTIESYDANTGQLIQQSSSNVGSGTYAQWDVNLGGSVGIQGKQLIHQENDITLDDSKVSTVEGGTWTPQNPWNASVRQDSRTSLTSPSGITGNMIDHSISYDGTDWFDNGVWRGPQGARGIDGADGADGTNGTNGQDGADGVDGDTPAHQWNGTSLRFENPDGTWGSYTDLKGEQGEQGEDGEKGDAPAHQWSGTSLRFQNPDDSWGDYTDLQGPKGDKPAHQWSNTSLRFENPDGSWGSYTDLKGDPGDQGDAGISGKILTVTTGTASTFTLTPVDGYNIYHVWIGGVQDVTINIPNPSNFKDDKGVSVPVMVTVDNRVASSEDTPGEFEGEGREVDVHTDISTWDRGGRILNNTVYLGEIGTQGEGRKSITYMSNTPDGGWHVISEAYTKAAIESRSQAGNIIGKNDTTTDFALSTDWQTLYDDNYSGIKKGTRWVHTLFNCQVYNHDNSNLIVRFEYSSNGTSWFPYTADMDGGETTTNLPTHRVFQWIQQTSANAQYYRVRVKVNKTASLRIINASSWSVITYY